MVETKPPHLPFSRPTISEAAIAEVATVLRSGWITSGPKVAEFERDFAAFTGAAHAVAVCSATGGLDLVIEALDLKPGDEVITPSINWVSAPNMVELHGGTTVFCDVVADTLQLDLKSVERLITPRTRAILPVHFAGAPCDLDGLRALVAGRDIRLIEDAAHATGAKYRGKIIGGDSEVAVFSFHPTKNLTTAEGGMVTCRDQAFAETLMSAEASATCGAAYNERTEERTNSRNGYRRRPWDTRAGSIDLAVPKLREGSYFPDWLLTPRRRAGDRPGLCGGRVHPPGRRPGQSHGHRRHQPLGGLPHGGRARRQGRRL